MKVNIRTARRSDADGIADVHVAGFRAGYHHVIPESVLFSDEFDAARRTFWTEWRFAPGHRLAVASIPNPPDDRGDDGPGGTERIIAFSSYGPERTRLRGFTGRGEVWAFFLHPDFWGRGLADRLFAYTEERLRAEGFDAAMLWVVADNPRARRFYERHGWAVSGIEADFGVTSELRLPTVEYRKQLSEQPTA